MPLAKAQTIELRFPALGVDRRRVQERVASAVNYPSPWCVNVRLNDGFDRRLRGGSRPGLTKFVSDDMGLTISALASIAVSSAADGTSDILVVMVDSTIRTIENGTTSTGWAYITDEAGNFMVDEAGNRLITGFASAPASGFLVTGQQNVYVIGSGSIFKVDPKGGNISTLSATVGTIPTGVTFGAVYRDRLVLSGNDNAIHMSRKGDYGDFDYSVDVSDTTRAMPFQLSLDADVGPLPTAMISHKDSYLLAASARTLWVVRGDPTTGELRRISENVGIISSLAWAKVEDQIYFLAEDGIYRVSADGSDLRPLSENVPAELRDVDTSTVTVTMGWEQDRKAVHIYLRTSGGTDTHWLYELESDAWWPMTLQDSQSPLAVAQHKGELLLAGSDGYIRYISGSDDDGTAISSHVLLGPIRLGSAMNKGMIRTITGIMAQGSGSVTWRMVLGDTADEAADRGKAAIEASIAGNSFDQYVAASGSLSAGRNKADWPRRRGAWAILWLDSSSAWAYESVVVERLADAGRWR